MNFQDEFERETRDLPVRDTNIATIITTARSRTRRRRVAASTLAVGALVVGTAVGVEQLSRVRTTNPNTNPNLVQPPAPAVSPDDGTATTTTIPYRTSRYVMPASSTGIHLDNAVPAQLAPANITWTVIDQNSPEALPFKFDSSQRYALATVPGSSPSDVGTTGLFEQVNGEWNRVNFNRNDLEPIVSGDTVYGIGTASATAGGPEGAFGTFDVSSGTWRLHETPEQIRVYQSENVDTYQGVSLAPVDGGVIAAVWTQVLPSMSKFPELGGPNPWWVENNELHTYVDCDEDRIYEYLTTTTDYGEAGFKRIYQENCTDKTLNSVEMGLSQADLDAMSHPDVSSLWKVTPDAMVPVEIPGVSLADAYLSISQRVLSVQRPDWSVENYVIGSDGSLTRAFADLPQDQSDRLTVGVATGPGAQPVSGGYAQYLLTQLPGAATQATDLLSTVAAPDRLNPAVEVYSVDRTDSLTLAYGTLQYDPPGTLTEPTTITDSGYSLEITPDGYRVIDNSTGLEPPAEYGLSTETGKVELSILTDSLIYSDPTVPTTLATTEDASLSGTVEPNSAELVTTTVVSEAVPAPTTVAPAPAGYDAVNGDADSSLTNTSSDQPEQAPSTTVYPTMGSVASDPAPHVATFDIDWATVPGLNTKTKQLLFTSVDGVSVAVSDLEAIVRDAVGLADGEYVSLQDVQTTGDGRFVLSVYKTAISDAHPGQNLLLVGTPN